MGAAYSYRPGLAEDFDDMGLAGRVAPGDGNDTYWSAVGNSTEYALNLSLAVATDLYPSASAWNARGAMTDRHLGVYKTANGENARLVARFRNDTGSTLRTLELYYDLECAWSRFTSTSLRRAALAASISSNATTWVALPAAFSAAATNANASVPAQQWMSDAEMDAWGMSRRNLGGTVDLTQAPYFTVPTGGTFYVRWDASGGSASTKQINVGVDNLRGPAGAQDIRIRSIAMAGASTELTSSGVADVSASQIVQYSADLLQTNWTDVVTNAGALPAPSKNSWSLGAVAPGFYRIVER